jgi:DNA mismatch endonuclease (patch repair protein)
MGYRFRLCRKDLPGKPDIVLASRKKVVFVHGCFWHSHDSTNCPDYRCPKSNRDYWEPKLRGNAERDRVNVATLQSMGWETLVLWACELKDAGRVEERLLRFLSRADS